MIVREGPPYVILVNFPDIFVLCFNIVRRTEMLDVEGGSISTRCSPAARICRREDRFNGV